MNNPMPPQDAIHEAQFAVTQAEELLDLARGRLAKAKKEFLDHYLQPPAPTLTSAGFTVNLEKTTAEVLTVPLPPPLTCFPCRTLTNGAHHLPDPQCLFHSYRKDTP